MELEAIARCTIIVIGLIISCVAGYIYLKYYLMPKYCSTVENDSTDFHPYEEIRDGRELLNMSPTVTQYSANNITSYPKPSTSDSANEGTFTDSSCSRDSAISSSNTLYPINNYQNLSEVGSITICEHDVLTIRPVSSPYLQPLSPPIPPRMPIGSPRKLTTSPSLRTNYVERTYPLPQGTLHTNDIHLSVRPPFPHESIHGNIIGSPTRSYKYTQASTHISSVIIPPNLLMRRALPEITQEDLINEDHQYESLERNKRLQLLKKHTVVSIK